MELCRLKDAVSMGLDVPVRKSGDHRDSPGCWLMGPAGIIELPTGVIRHGAAMSFIWGRRMQPTTV